jgi:hypothetical protein
MAKFFNPVSFPTTFNFTNQNNMTITHNLGYQPMVYLVVNGQMAFCNVTHNSINELVVTFQNEISGTIFLR